MLRLLPWILLAGCVEYNLNSPDAPVVPERTDPSTIAEPTPDALLPQVCDGQAPDDFGVSLLDECRREPAIGDFDPVVEWTWGLRRVENPPLVANMSDDNGSGFVNDADIPARIVTSFSGGSFGGFGWLDVIDGASRRTAWSLQEVSGHSVYALAGLAVADLEADGEMDIVVTVDGGVARVGADGAPTWFTALPMTGGGGATVSIADMDEDGLAEIVVNGAVLNADGTIRWMHPDHTGKRIPGTFPADVDGDGLMEVVAGGMLLNHDGTERWRARSFGGWPATIDLEVDGVTEFVQVRGGLVTVFDRDGAELWSFNSADGGGPPTVADFDGDNLPEIGFAGKTQYRVLDTDGSLLWQRPIQETSSGFTSSAVFDFEPDGAAEVVYADEQTLWVFDGSTGAVELELSEHNSGTRYEYPTIADVDGDGSAEIIVPHGRERKGSAMTGLSIIGSRTDSWAAARPIWNQHAYHTTHINDDGTVPIETDANWDLYNNFRAGNSEVPLGLETPDLRVGEPVACEEECYDDVVVWHVPVFNQGFLEAGPVRVHVSRVDDDALLFEEVVPTIGMGQMMWPGPSRTTKALSGTGGMSNVVDSAGGTESGEGGARVEEN